MGGTSARDGDLFTVVGVNALGVVGIAVSLFDFFMIQGRTLFMLEPLGVATFALGLGLEFTARRALEKQFAVVSRPRSSRSSCSRDRTGSSATRSTLG